MVETLGPWSSAPGPRRIRRITLFLAIAGALILALPGTSHAETFRFSGDETTVIFAEGQERTALRGSATITSDDTTISAAEIEIYGEDFRYAVARGGVEAADLEREIYITADELFFDREQDILRAEGNAVLEDRKNELVVKGNLLENRSSDEVTIAQVAVRILGEELTARSEFALYRRETEVLELSGLPVVFWKGDEYRAARIVVDLQEDEISLEGDVRGRITTEGDPDEEDAEEADAPEE
jgi:lipopolysaccharide export system protein LptA